MSYLKLFYKIAHIFIIILSVCQMRENPTYRTKPPLKHLTRTIASTTCFFFMYMPRRHCPNKNVTADLTESCWQKNDFLVSFCTGAPTVTLNQEGQKLTRLVSLARSGTDGHNAKVDYFDNSPAKELSLFGTVYFFLCISRIWQRMTREESGEQIQHWHACCLFDL